MDIRPARPDDDRALAHLDAESWPLEVQVAPPQPADQPFFSDRRRPEDVIVAEDDGTLLGYLRVGRHMAIAANDHVLHIDALVVSESARGGGVGGKLVAAGIAEARRRKVTKLGLRALSTNPVALRLYERHGFVEEARLHGELRRPNGEYADDVWMALWLDDEVSAR